MCFQCFNQELIAWFIPFCRVFVKPHANHITDLGMSGTFRNTEKDMQVWRISVFVICKITFTRKWDDWLILLEVLFWRKALKQLG